MEITLGLFLVFVLMAFICEYIDSSFGMGYGTILSPILLIIGYDPMPVVLSVLLSQAFGGLAASIFHHKLKNMDITKESKDTKIVAIITGFGILATVVGAVVAVSIPKVYLRAYIAIIILVMGILLLFGINFKFGWKKIVALGLFSAFNKVMTGGGYGPVVTGGQVLSGQSCKESVGCTTLAEAPICLVGFFSLIMSKMVIEYKTSVLSIKMDVFVSRMIELTKPELTVALLIGAILVAPFGALTIKNMNQRFARVTIGCIITALGVWSVVKLIA